MIRLPTHPRCAQSSERRGEKAMATEQDAQGVMHYLDMQAYVGISLPDIF